MLAKIAQAVMIISFYAALFATSKIIGLTFLTAHIVYEIADYLSYRQMVDELNLSKQLINRKQVYDDTIPSRKGNC